ncbi:hypothetical protein C922_04615 [Plasmodium inui San Antonio 1]|uniref:Uncharacterized protein n=1 Tax=Plasmodium inui San Antonio 1 TaxID=1237626 RepID=W6ZW18_9APIC|nr:hypothetical protein C922_04615 [Plasmodium inui San Antonio 1]EUD64987.1 hypothetical protein C922_04615 [Plasmodium inui San Antonio 1]
MYTFSYFRISQSSTKQLNIYWTLRYEQLNKQEILSDRFTWLYERMLEDEVHKTLLQKLPSYNFKNNGPENMLGSSQI